MSAPPRLSRLARLGRRLLGSLKAQALPGTSRNRATGNDIENAYAFLLGRGPESDEAITSRADKVLGEVVRSFLRSSEFAMLYAGLRLAPGTKEGPPIPGELAGWAMALVGGSAELKQLAERRPSRQDFLLHWLGDRRTRRAFPIIPALLDGPVIGHLDEASPFIVRGWALDLLTPHHTVLVRILGGGKVLGIAEAGLTRSDIGRHRDILPRCGFSFVIPRGLLDPGQRCSITVVDDRTGQVIGSPQRIDPGSADAGYPIEAYAERADLDEHARVGQSAEMLRASTAAELPSICFLLVADTAAEAKISDTLASIRAQLSPNWELVLVDVSAYGAGPALIDAVFGEDRRVRCLQGRPGLDLGAATDGLSPDYLWPLTPGSVLSADAAYQVGRLAAETGAVAIYTDHDHLADRLGLRFDRPALKPDFDYDLLLSTDYIGPAVALRMDRVKQAGGLGEVPTPSMGEDLLLRIAETAGAGAIAHLPLALLHLPDGETPPAAKRIERLNRHFEAGGIPATAEIHQDPSGQPVPAAAHIRWRLPDPAPSVAIIIPTRDGVNLLRDCVDSIEACRADYRGLQEILIVDNCSSEPETLAYLDHLGSTGSARIIPYPHPFNWSAINNHAAALTRADILVFLNNDTVVRTKDWLTELASLAMRSDVGAVGARLLYPDGTVQHAGMLASFPRGFLHDSIGADEPDGSYGDRVKLTRETLAVTGACLATRRSLFDEMGGFDAAQFTLTYNDVDYCLRLRRAGYRILYCAFAVLTHFESKTRGPSLDGEKLARERLEAARMRQIWREEIQRDPFYNPNFDRRAGPFERILPQGD